MADDYEFKASERRRQREIDSSEDARRTRRDAQRARQRRIHRRRRLAALGVLAVGIAGASGAWVMTGSPKATPESTIASTKVVKPAKTPAHIAMPAHVRGVHLSGPSMTIHGKYASVLDLARSGGGGLNTVEIDLKDESGELSFVKGAPALAKAIGATKNYVDLRTATRLAHERGVYVIGRIVCFQDPILATQRPALAIRTKSGGIWADPNSHKQWVNEYDARVGAYLISIGKAALALGVDEIQFDYIRFPTYSGGVWPHARKESRSTTINTFLAKAHAAFAPAKLAVSVFGIADVHPTDGASIGQVIPDLEKNVDVISPMIYPTLYNAGEFDLPNPKAAPGTVVARTLGFYKGDLLGSRVQLRPWLQDYDGYGYDQVAKQVRAADSVGVDGWLLWDSSVQYQERALNITVR